MTRYFLETSVIISYLRSEKGVVDAINRLEGELTSSYLCLAELYEGVARSKESKKVEQGVTDFFHGLDEIYGVDESIAKYFGTIRAALKKRGEIIEDMDILMAATCLAYEATLITANIKHFQRIENLKLFSLEIRS